MGMSAGGGIGKAVSEINVTPLIDVLLVLLIIFMVIVPVNPSGLKALVPQPPRHDSPENPDTIVVQVQASPVGEPSYLINGTAIPKSQIESKLAAIFSTRQEKVMFVRADNSLEFSTIAEVIDMGHQAQVSDIGLITPRIAVGQ
jgi:biopolymer transport protein TolR